MSQNHPARLRRRPRSENDLDNVATLRFNRPPLKRGRAKVIQIKCGYTVYPLPPRTDYQLRLNLSRYMFREIRTSDGIHWNGNHAARHASEKRRNPFTGICAPDQNMLAPLNPPAIQFIRKPTRRSQQPRITPALDFVSTPPYHCNLTRWTRVRLEIFEHRPPWHNLSFYQFSFLILVSCDAPLCKTLKFSLSQFANCIYIYLALGSLTTTDLI